jgi:mono/diheme cytochrome c family protein
MVRYLAFASLSVLLWPLPLLATCRARRVVAVKEVVVVKKKVVPAIVLTPLAAYVPGYLVVGSVYTGPAPGVYAPTPAPVPVPTPAATPVPRTTTSTETSTTTTVFTEAQKAWLRKEIRAAVGDAVGKPSVREVTPGATATPATPKEESRTTDAPAIFAKNCAKCHTAGPSLNAKTSFEMFSADGKMKDLPDKQWAKVGARVALAEMPPPIKDAAGKESPAMSDEDAAIVANYIKNRK